MPAPAPVRNRINAVGTDAAGPAERTALVIEDDEQASDLVRLLLEAEFLVGAGQADAARGQILVEEQARAVDGAVVIQRLRLLESLGDGARWDTDSVVHVGTADDLAQFLRIGVQSEEMPATLPAAVDLLVDGPSGLAGLLDAVASRLPR